MTLRTTVRPGALADIRVLDLAGESGVFAGRVLAELGADVIRIEPPDGDSIRRRRPFVEGAAGHEASLYHQHFNAGKRSVSLDLRLAEEREVLSQLIATADVLLETPGGEGTDSSGVDLESMSALNPRLIHAAITPFGQTGPMAGYRGNDLVAAAMSGVMYLNGFPEDPPNVPGAEQAYHMGSLAAVTGMLLALVERDHAQDEPARRVDVSLQQAASMATIQTANANYYTWHREIQARGGLTGTGGARTVFQCADDLWVSFVIPPPYWAAFVDWLDEENIEHDLGGADWHDLAFRLQHTRLIAGAVAGLMSRFARAHAVDDGQRRHLLVMPVNNVADLFADPQMRDRAFFEERQSAALDRPLTDAGVAYHLSATPAGLSRPAPLLGEHNAEVLRESRDGEATAARGATSRAPAGGEPHPRRLPLEGIRVADFSWLIAGPATTRILADFGAEVIKVESRYRIDRIREGGVQPPAWSNADSNGVFNDCNTNKRSITLNLNTAQGIELARELVRRSDIVANNFTASRMGRWGLGYDQLRAIREDVIMLSMPVMGASGPLSHYGAYGNGVIAYGGLNQNMGFPNRPPVGMAPLYSDFAAPYFGASAVLAALHHRHRTGEGQFIELSQAEVAASLLGTGPLEYSVNGAGPATPRKPRT